jgi:hypothetical protein
MSPVAGTSPGQTASLLSAASDLRVVRLIRGAIAEPVNLAKTASADAPGGFRPASDSAGADCVSDRRVHQPEPYILPREVHRPEPVADVEVRPAVIEADALLAPWQAVLREKVWNRPVQTPPAAAPTDVAMPYQTAGYGLSTFDAFI